MKTKNIGIYIHIPFCKRKCEYCDFVSYSNCNNLIPEYVKWLKYEIREIGDSNKLDFENGLDDFVIVKTSISSEEEKASINNLYPSV